MINNFVKSQEGSIVISIILGLGLASLFRKVCNENNCVIIKSPAYKDIENKVFKQDEKCYTYKPERTKCEN